MTLTKRRVAGEYAVPIIPGLEDVSASESNESLFSKWGPSALTFLGGLFAMVPSISGIKNPVFGKGLMIIGATAVTGVLIFYVFKSLKFLTRKLEERRFVKKESVRLQDLLRQFQSFAGKQNEGRLRNIITSAFGPDRQIMESFLPSEHSRIWSECLNVQLATPTTSLEVLAARAHEFTLLVEDFDAGQAQRVQKAITSSKNPLHEAYIDMLEEFSDDFNAFLRDLEKWAGAFNDYAIERIGWERIPKSKFEKVKSFQHKKAMGA